MLPIPVKGCLIDKFVILYTGVKVKHWRIAVPKLQIDFSHLPFEGGFIETGEVLRQQ